jgi:NAD dependent epimerase/dehydratase family enzyme
MTNKKIVLAGGTGFIGTYMANYFGKENEVIILTRRSSEKHNNAFGSKEISTEAKSNVRWVTWNGKSEGDWINEIDGADIVINLAGRSVNCRYNYRNMKEIFDSRLKATKVLGKAINKAAKPPKLWINAASATIYRNALDRAQDEFTGEISELKAMNMPNRTMEDIKSFIYKFAKWFYPSLFIPKKQKLRYDFSVKVCKRWEESFWEIETPQTRKVCLRIAITLGPGGVIVPYMNLLKFGLGGRQGNGRQMYSWVHVEDLCRLVDWLEQHEEAEGTFNCASPHPINNREFMKKMRKSTGHLFALPAFKWMLEIGTKIIGSEPELILKSRWVIPSRLLQSGFKFAHACLDDALENIIGQTKRNRYHLF